jgi:predicted RNA-binding protein
MATTHVFIVDSTTFKLHLEYLFAGTGAKDITIDFNNGSKTALPHTTENNLIGMIADSQRIRKGDYIIFYLQQSHADKIYEGKFYGVFKAKEDLSFLDNNDGSQFLKTELNKSLTFRTLIEPFEVYPVGITEWEALDEIKNIKSPYQMLWSLIYRKLKGNRGNTMITLYESEKLFKLFRDKNGRKTLNVSNLTFDSEKQQIKEDKTKRAYSGRKEAINIVPRLVSKYNLNRAFETHLQAYIVQRLGRKINQNLDNIILNGASFEWLGNEVSCGVGMQRIDVMLSIKGESSRLVIPIELKAVEASTINVIQIQRYVDWLEQYYLPNMISDIQPILISKKITDKNDEDYKEVIESFKAFNKKNKDGCLKLKYIEYEVIGNDLKFIEITY